MNDAHRKLGIKLIQRFVDVLAEIELRCAENGEIISAGREFWDLWNAINGAAARLGLPCNDTPITLSRPPSFNVEEFLEDVIAEGKARGGELTL